MVPSRIQHVENSDKFPVQIVSVAQIVDELVCNALDADATEITIELNLPHSLSIRDNGDGIPSPDFALLAQHHCSSRPYAPHLPTMRGYRGLALAAMAQIADMKIVSKARGSFVSSEKLMSCSSGVVEYCGTSTTPLQQHGTFVCLSSLFANQPVRQALLTKQTPFIIHTLLQQALLHPNVAFTLSSPSKCLVSLPRHISALTKTFGALTPFLTPISFEQHGIVIAGHVMQAPLGYMDQQYQFTYLNGRHVGSSIVSRVLDDLFHRITHSMQRNLRRVGKSERARRAKLEEWLGEEVAAMVGEARHAAFVLNVSCPFAQYRLHYDAEGAAPTCVMEDDFVQLLEGVVRGVGREVWAKVLPASLLDEMERDDDDVVAALPHPSPPPPPPPPRAMQMQMQMQMQMTTHSHSHRIDSSSHRVAPSALLPSPLALLPPTPPLLLPPLPPPSRIGGRKRIATFLTPPLPPPPPAAKRSLQWEEISDDVLVAAYDDAMSRLHPTMTIMTTMSLPPPPSHLVPLAAPTPTTRLTLDLLAARTASPPLVPHSIHASHLRQACILPVQLFQRRFLPLVYASRSGSRVLALLDQHAADERIRYEDLINQVKRNGCRLVPVPNSPPLPLSVDELQGLETYRDALTQWGFDWVVEEGGSVVVLTRAVEVYGKLLTPRDFHSLLTDVMAMRGGLASHFVPRCVLHVLASRACRSAIMFGDVLDAMQCKALVYLLHATKQSLQCAHGRPTVAPLCDVRALCRARETLRAMENGCDGGVKRVQANELIARLKRHLGRG